MLVSLIGISHRTAPVAVRERVFVRASRVPAVLQRITADFPDFGWVLLSTCNRTELYAAGVDTASHQQRLMEQLLDGRARGDAAAGLLPHVYVKRDRAVAEHLFAVASSLDSLVAGETEILGQVKQALALAADAGTVNKPLTTLFQRAFRAAKRVHTETGICRGRVSVSSLAVAFVEKIFDDLTDKTAMVVGAGATAEQALKSLVDRGIKDVLVLNRSHHHGETLAHRCGGRAYRFELLDTFLVQTDIVISSTGAPHLVIGADAVKAAMAARGGRPLLLIDIAVPRDIEPQAGEIENVHACTIDDLERIAADNLSKRRGAIEQAWRVIGDELSLHDAGGRFAQPPGEPDR